MTGTTAALAYPGSRALAEWWRHIASYRPQVVWVAHLLLYRVEALVRLARPYRPEDLALLALEAVAIDSPATLERVESRLHLGIQLTGRILCRLAADGVVEFTEAGWALTRSGKRLVGGETVVQAASERRSFYFIDNGSHSLSHFLALAPGLATPCSAPNLVAMDLSALTKCVEQPMDWKVRHGFPLDVHEVVLLKKESSRLLSPESADSSSNAARQPDPAEARIPPWQRVAVVHPESVILLLASVPSADGVGLIGFAVQQKGWMLQGKEPIRLSQGWREAMPRLAEPLSTEGWRQAWNAWARSTGLPTAQTAGCPLECQGHRLVATVPSAVFGRLRAARSEALKGEVWLLAGDDRVRQAAQLQIVAGSG
jgi:hypothetical protein